jgi:hypothetical protein
MKHLLVILLFFPLACCAQNTIVGRVISQTDKKPVAAASVFLSNTQAGTITADNGSFTLTNVKAGQYDLVVSSVGYETYHYMLRVAGDMRLPDLEIAPKAIALHEVKIIPDAEKARLYEMFKRQFFGSSPYADQCKILNPDVVDIDYDKPNRTLSATSSDFIVIENKALGYRVKYLLTSFSNDEREHMLYFEGSTLFEELKGTKHQQREWLKNRLTVYKGSSMHFLRSLLSDDIYEQGFKVLRLVRKINPDYFKDGKKYNETLYTTPLKVSEMVKLTDVKGLYALSFPDCLYVLYSKEMNATPVDQMIKNGQIVPDYLNDYITTTVIFEKPNAIFDSNGIFIDPSSVVFEGQWGISRIAEMLPVDYDPQSTLK